MRRTNQHLTETTTDGGRRKIRGVKGGEGKKRPAENWKKKGNRLWKRTRGGRGGGEEEAAAFQPGSGYIIAPQDLKAESAARKTPQICSFRLRLQKVNISVLQHLNQKGNWSKLQETSE